MNCNCPPMPDSANGVEFTAGSILEVQLDIVGFLAILGEASVLANAQVMFLSKWCFLPRLLPAPQGLIRTERPERLQPSSGKVVGSHSGNVRPEMNHVAHVLHSEGDKLQPYSVAIVSLEEDNDEDPVKAAWVSPVIGLSLLGAAFALALLILSIVLKDGFSLISVLLLSTLSSAIGVGQKWTLKLPERPKKGDVPTSDVIICYPNGAFLIVKCNEDIARRLYWAPERCEYLVNTNIYRAISLIGTVMLMVGVICLANAKQELQIAWGAAYLILNAAYWAVAALPARWNWFLKSFKVEDVKLRKLLATSPVQSKDMWQEPRKLRRASTDMRKPGTKRPSDKDDLGTSPETFTQALWLTIACTKTSHWVKAGQISPQTDGWSRWLEKAETAAAATRLNRYGKEIYIEVPEWDAQGALTAELNQNRKNEPQQEPKNVGTELV